MNRQPSDDTSVLIVEGESALADLYATWLSESYETEAAYSESDALDCLEEGQYDVVLLDDWMRHSSGSDVLDTICERDLDCAVALLTTEPPDFDLIKMDVESHLLKPVSHDELHDVVEQLGALIEYPQCVQELYSLVDKQSMLEAEKPPHELQANDEFAAMNDEISTLRSRTEDSVEDSEDEAFRALFEGRLTRGAERNGRRRTD